MPAECADYSLWPVAKLKSELQKLGFTTTGSKESLVERLEQLAPAKAKTEKKRKAETKEGLLKKDVKAKPAGKTSGKVVIVSKAAKASPKVVAKGKTLSKAKLSRKKSHRSAEDVGDLHSPAASLHCCLRKVPTVAVLKALIGPGPCLLKAMPKKTSEKLLRSMIEANEFECQATKLAGISLQHRLAIRIYTAEDPVPVYRTLNLPFNSHTRSPSSIVNQAPFMKLLVEAVKALKKAGHAYNYVGPAYRGVKVASSPLLKTKYKNYIESFKVGSRLTFAAFTSLSLADNTAESFGDKILFQFTRVRGVRIADLSAIPSELEILVEPPAVFEVKSCAKFHGVLSVVLESVDSPLRYL